MVAGGRWDIGVILQIAYQRELNSMISFERSLLANGLRVLVHEDHTTPMAVVNILYNVGARDEQEDKTGFAHLFEHLMFAGSKNVPSFDRALQHAGGNNNAFTTNDLTNYYEVVPASNIETALWVEADRLAHLNINSESLEVQRSVVSEEFKQHYINQPYGDAWHLLRALAYQTHPYKWPTIGKDLSHIENASLGDVQAFFEKHYTPSNALLVVAGGVEVDRVLPLVERWFGSIPGNNLTGRTYPSEPQQSDARRKQVTASVPSDALFLAFHGPSRMDPGFYEIAILAELLGSGKSSRLYQRLVKDQKLFAGVEAYLTGNLDPGLLVIDGHVLEGVDPQRAEDALWFELNALRNEAVTEKEIGKIRNRIEHDLAVEELDLKGRAFNLALFELLGDANLYNEEAQKYSSVTAESVQAIANRVLLRENCSTLDYRKQQPSLN